MNTSGLIRSFEFQDLDLLRHDGTVVSAPRDRQQDLERQRWSTGCWGSLTAPCRKMSRWVLPGDIRESLKTCGGGNGPGKVSAQRFGEGVGGRARLTPDLRRLKSWYGVDTDHLWNLPG